MKHIIILLSFFYFSSFAQNAVLKGRITDSNTGEPLKGAIVFISSSNIAYTGSDGSYTLSDLNKGSYELKISHLSYKTITELVSIEGDTEINYLLESSPLEMYEVVVSTNRFDRHMTSSPYSELMVTQEQIELKPFQTLPDVLKEEPGLSIMSDGVWGKEISIRGLNRENIVTLIDGNRIATATDIAARLSLVDLNDIERVEVIKGASSSIYGSGATGGIINIISKTPSIENSTYFSGNLSAGYNSVNSSAMTAGSLTGGGSSWSSKISGSYRKADNTQTPDGELKNSQFKDYSFSGNLNISPLANHLLQLNYQLFKAEDVGIPGSSVFPDAADVSYPYERRELISAGYEIKNISSFFYKLDIKYSHQLIERDVLNIPHTVQNVAASGTTPARRVSVLKITPHADHNNNNISLQGSFMLSTVNNLVAGIDYWDRKYDGHREKYQKIEVLDTAGNVRSTTDKIIGEQPLPDSKYSSLGFFVQDYAELIKSKLILSVGARVDKIDVSGSTTYNPVYEITNGTISYTPSGQKIIWNETEANDASYSSNIGLKYSVNQNLDMALSLGYSFRSPSLEERFQYIDQGTYVRIGNPDLNSEIGKSADLELRYYFNKFKITTGLFFNYFTDMVVEKPGTFEGRTAYIKTNVGEARLYGFDLGTSYNFYSDFLIYANAAYVKGDDITSGGNLPEIAPLNGTVGISAGVPGYAVLDLSSIIFAKQNDPAVSEPATPGYAIFNLTVKSEKISFGKPGFFVTAGIENIFDKSYRNHLSSARGTILSEPGRNFFIKLITSW
jgi:hemoglobin/transferrin/lactoferrin receptor protein